MLRLTVVTILIFMLFPENLKSAIGQNGASDDKSGDASDSCNASLWTSSNIPIKNCDATEPFVCDWDKVFENSCWPDIRDKMDQLNKRKLLSNSPVYLAVVRELSSAQTVKQFAVNLLHRLITNFDDNVQASSPMAPKTIWVIKAPSSQTCRDVTNLHEEEIYTIENDFKIRQVFENSRLRLPPHPPTTDNGKSRIFVNANEFRCNHVRSRIKEIETRIDAAEAGPPSWLFDTTPDDSINENDLYDEKDKEKMPSVMQSALISMGLCAAMVLFGVAIGFSCRRPEPTHVEGARTTSSAMGKASSKKG